MSLWGGEEFVIIFNNADKDGIIKSAENIRKQVEFFNFDFGDTKGNITVSIGLSIFEDDYSENNDVLRFLNIADERLYKAKNTGKNKVIFSN